MRRRPYVKLEGVKFGAMPQQAEPVREGAET